MAAPIFLGEPLFLGLRAEMLGDFASRFGDDVAAFGHAERLFEQPEMIEFGAGRMLERFEP